MAVTIHIPTPLRVYTERQASVTVEAATVGAGAELTIVPSIAGGAA